MSTAEEETRTPEEIEDEVMNRLPQLNVTGLVGICELLQLTVPEDMKEKRSMLFKFLMKNLCNVEEKEDGNFASVLLIDTALRKETEKPAEVKVETVAVEKKERVLPRIPAGVPRQEPLARIPEQQRWSNWKVHGVIGGSSADKQMSFASLKYQVSCAQQIGLPESVICPAVVKAICSTNDIREFLEDVLVSDPERADLEFILEVLSSQCSEQDSAHYFLQMQNLVQDSAETLVQFITKLFVLRQKVLKLSKEEGLEYDKTLVSKRFFHALFTGIRHESTRSALKERCKDDYTLSEPQLFKFANEVMTHEAERKEKLSKKGGDAAVINHVAAEQKKVASKTEKPNPFVLIEEMKAIHKNEMTVVKAELAEIKNAVVNPLNNTLPSSYLNNRNEEERRRRMQVAQQGPGDFNANNNGGFGFNNANNGGFGGFNNANNGRGGRGGGRNFGNPGGGRRRPTRRCANCVTADAFRCFHCFRCGSDEHKIFQCPEQENVQNADNNNNDAGNLN